MVLQSSFHIASASRAWPSKPNSVSLSNSSRNLPMKGLGKRVLLWFARRDVVPVQDRHAGELRPVVRDAHRRTTTSGSGRVELAYYPASRTARNGYRCAG